MNLQEKVNQIVNQINSRNSKIEEKIKVFEAKVNEGTAEINKLMSALVDYDLDGNIKAIQDTDKKIAKLRLEIEDATGKIKAYRASLNGKDLVKNELPELFDMLREQQEDTTIEINNNSAAIEKARQDIISLQKQIQDLTTKIQLSSNNGKCGENSISALIKYVESRPVEKGSEFQYLLALSRGQDIEIFLEHPKDYSNNIPYQSIPKVTTREVIEPTRPTEHRSIEKSHQFHA
jgi:chromosome segregation ATPase